MTNYKVFDENPITPLPGVLIATPYFEETKGFKLADDMARKELASYVLAVGEGKALNVYGVEQTTTAKVGDVIIHRTFEVEIYNHMGLDLRFVKFDDIRGILNVKI